MLKVFRIFWLSLIFLGLLGVILMPYEVEAENSSTIEVLHVDGVIVPVVADYINRGLEKAEQREVSLCVIELTTPGGLYATTQKIVQRILNAKLPVAVYVSPAGGWAGSAGTFITLAAHIAGMAPGSRIGAATPVSMEGKMPEEMKKKVTEDAAAWIRSIAEMRGRDPHHAELAVREGKSYTDREALEYNLINLRADTLEDLISKLDGWEICLAPDKVITLHTKDYTLNQVEMTTFERILHTISDPNIAYILLSLGMLGLITEISHPGLIFPGITGGVCLAVAFYSLGVLGINWLGVMFILLAFGCFVAEFFTSSFGLCTGGGIICLIIGSMMLVKEPSLQIDWWVIGGVAACLAAVVIFIAQAVIRTQRKKPTVGAGAETMIGKIGIVKTPLDPVGTIHVRGELWQAQIEEGKAEPGEEVRVTKVEGLKLWVKKEGVKNE